MTLRLLRARAASCVVVLIAGLLSGCGDEASPATQDYATELGQRISTDAVMGHLRQLQAIADANGGTRQTGTPGYDASVDYVANALRDKGFDVQMPEFDVGLFRVDAESLAVNGVPVTARAVENSAAAPAGGVTGPLVTLPSDSSPGCEAQDYDGLDARGAVVLVDRGSCYLSDKALLAAERGAVGVVVVNDVDEKVFSGGLLEEDKVTVPVLSVSRADGAKIRGQSGEATVVLDSRIDHLTSRSVIATTTTGSTDDVVLVGAHLDSVRQGPGINDNGSGVAVVLETALQMGAEPDVPRAVRFVFWGGEEEYLLGSESYVSGLDEAQLQSIAAYLNVDMAGSPNPGYLVLDANLSTAPDPELGFGVPDGSVAIERAFADYLDEIGTPAQDLAYDGRGDWAPFAMAGVPVGGLSTGGEALKTAEQAQLWGGEAGEPYDPNYHSADDTLAGVNPAALDITGPAVAHVIGLFASADDNDGLPPVGQRERQPLMP